MSSPRRRSSSGTLPTDEVECRTDGAELAAGPVPQQHRGGQRVPLDAYTFDLTDAAGLRRIPLLDVWQVDRDYGSPG